MLIASFAKTVKFYSEAPSSAKLSGMEELLRKQEKTRESAADQGRDRAPKRLRTDNETPFYETVATSLFEVWKLVRADASCAKNIDVAKVEIEVRVGHIVADFRRWKSQCSRKSICSLTGLNDHSSSLISLSSSDLSHSYVNSFNPHGMTSEILIVDDYFLRDQIRRSLTWALPFNLVSIKEMQIKDENDLSTHYSLFSSLISPLQ